MSPSTHRLRTFLVAGWSIWAPRRAGSAWLCPPAGDKRPCSRVRFGTLDRAVAEGVLVSEQGAHTSDTIWRRP